jgi:hypothetical protein|tara:strand:+ start:389 stop:1435 length:1047 start_codon:yes stop_codon:yes gene_type:complete
MSEFFESSESENIFVSHARGLRQRNAVIGILIAIIAVLVAILFVKGCDDDDSPSSIPVAVEESGSEESESEGPEDTPPEAATEEEDDNTDEEEAVVEPTPLPDDPESQILLGDYAWLDPSRSEATIALQELLEIEADGWYGMGTRTAHLAALEERGLPISYAAICDLTVGEDLCGVSPDAPYEEALATLTSGLGTPDDETDWYEACYAEYKDVSWGAVYARFIKIETGEDDQSEPTPPQLDGWGIGNQYDFDTQEWRKEFPAEVTFTESNLRTWDGDPSTFPEDTDTVIPAGSYVTPDQEDFQELIGHQMIEDQYWGFYTIITNQYKVVNLGIGVWDYLTNTSMLACD